MSFLPGFISCVFSFVFLLKKRLHFVLVLVHSLRNYKVLCAFIDLSTAERTAIQQSNYSNVKEVSHQDSFGVDFLLLNLPLNQRAFHADTSSQLV